MADAGRRRDAGGGLEFSGRPIPRLCARRRCGRRRTAFRRAQWRRPRARCRFSGMARHRPLAMPARYRERPIAFGNLPPRRKMERAGARGAGLCRQTVNTQTRFGPLVSGQGVTFRLWAPGARSASVVMNAPIAMARRGEWFEAHVSTARPGTRYRFRIDGELDIPDPASHFQPEDIGGPSEIIEHGQYVWKSKKWNGRPWETAVFLEAHVGTFTPEGTFRAMIARLDHLAQTGVTALELMPLADFPGRWNWGYDGVLPFAPDSAYGRPEDLKALIDAAHAR